MSTIKSLIFCPVENLDVYQAGNFWRLPSKGKEFISLTEISKLTSNVQSKNSFNLSFR